MLEIESKIKEIEHSKEYLKAKRAIKLLEDPHTERSIVSVASLDDVNEVVELRKNSADLAEYLRRYKGSMQRVTDRIDLLNSEKSRLKAQLISG